MKYKPDSDDGADVISFEHLNRKGLTHLLKQAWRRTAENSKPMHKRAKGEEKEDDEEEYEKLADLHEEQHGSSNPPKVAASDISGKPIPKSRGRKPKA